MLRINLVIQFVKEKCLSCWSSSRICITTHDSQNIKSPNILATDLKSIIIAITLGDLKSIPLKCPFSKSTSRCSTLSSASDRISQRTPSVCSTQTMYGVSTRGYFLILYNDQQMHNYFANYHTPKCFDTIVSSSGRLEIIALPSYRSISNAAVGNIIYN